MDLLNQAKSMLSQTNATCISINGDDVYQSELRGIAPIITKLMENPDFFQGATVADKVIGKSAALLLMKGNIKQLFTKVISEHALEVLAQTNIYVEYERKVPFIINRNGDGMCPMEESVLNLSDAEEGFLVLKKKFLNFTKVIIK